MSTTIAFRFFRIRRSTRVSSFAARELPTREVSSARPRVGRTIALDVFRVEIKHPSSLRFVTYRTRVLQMSIFPEGEREEGGG